MGLCCVANQVDGMGEALKNDISGVLMPRGDLNGWVDTLDMLLGDRSLRTGLGEGALKVARSRFSLSQMAVATSLVYESVLLDDALESTP